MKQIFDRKRVWPVNKARVPIIIKNAGSTIVENVTSLLAPIPSKLLPVSSAAITVKNFARARE